MDPQLSYERQFGYRSHRSTEDAIKEMQDFVLDTEDNMVLAILFDISGAFDNLRWESISRQLRIRQCDGNIYRLIMSYLKERSVRIEEDYGLVEKKIFKGCPQGSVLGPDFWNICQDEILIKLRDSGVFVIAYADDIVVLIRGNSRRKLESNSQQVVHVLVNWCKEQGLEISKKKTEMVILKSVPKAKPKSKLPGSKAKVKGGNVGTISGSIVNTGKGGVRPPTIKIEGKGIKYSQLVRYLGVNYGTNMNITEHVRIAASKGKSLFAKFSSIARSQWGASFSTLRKLYIGVFVPVVLYGIGAWDELMTEEHVRILESAQRFALIKVARAYRTCSTMALQVLCGTTPLGILATEKCHRYKIRKGVPFSYYDFQYCMIIPTAQAKEKLRSISNRIWQDSWDNSDKGRTTHSFIPSIEERLNNRHFKTGFCTTQFLTGHGDFRFKLFGFNLCDVSERDCGEEETSNHTLYDCDLYADSRQQWIDYCRIRNIDWPIIQSSIIKDKGMYEMFTRTANDILRLKKEYI